MYIRFPQDGKRIRGGVLVGVVEALESHLSGICERQQRREKNVRPLTFMDSAFTGYTRRVYGLSQDTFRWEWAGQIENCGPLFVYSGGVVAQGPKGSFRTPLRDFYPSVFARVSAEYSRRDIIPCVFLDEEASVGNYEKGGAEGWGQRIYWDDRRIIYLYEILIDLEFDWSEFVWK